MWINHLFFHSFHHSFPPFFMSFPQFPQGKNVDMIGFIRVFHNFYLFLTTIITNYIYNNINI